MNSYPSAARLKRSTEARWFFKGECPAAATVWFDRLDAGRPENRREDVYLRTGDPALNVKQREGRLEMKRRTREGEITELAPGMHGLVERWEKWSLEGGDAWHVPPPHDPRWIRIGKARRLVQFVPRGEGVAVAHGPTMSPTDCNVELTRLSVNGGRWWSICLEASGEKMEEMLLRTAARAGADGLALEGKDSYSYARWLLLLEEQAKR